MSRLSIKWIAAAVVAMTFSLAPLALAQKSVPCATAALTLSRNSDKTAVGIGDLVNANEAIDTTGVVTNCGKSMERFTVELIITDSNGNPTTIASASFRLKGGATAQALGNFIAGDFLGANSTSGTITVTGRILSSDGAVLATQSTSFTVVR